MSYTFFHSQQNLDRQVKAATTNIQPSGPTGNWNLIFDDEFDGTTVDPTKWSFCYQWDCHTGGNGELMVYDPQYATLNNGILTITAVKQKTCDGTYCANYGSSLIQTGKSKTGTPAKFTFTYGFMEARLQVPYGTGYFPAFWLLGPQSEIDLMEVFGNKTNFNCGVFVNHYGSHWGCPSHGTNTPPGSFHTFGVDWEQKQMTFYYDGAPVGSTSDPTKIPPDAMYILLNFAIGANFMPAPDATTVFPATMQADYVRVWKSSGQTASGSATPTISPTTPPQTTTTIIPTAPQGTINFLINLCPHGLGNCGDNVKPGSPGNKNIKHPTRAITVTFLDSHNTAVKTAQGTVSYDVASGTFTGVVNTVVPDGNYLITIKTPGFLVKQAPRIFTVTQGKQTTVPAFELITGDINSDGQVDILDYNILTGCYGTKQNTSSCAMPPTTQTSGADMNDDGLVDPVDYNLFLRELSVQRGE